MRPLFLLFFVFSCISLAAEPPPISAFTDPPKYLGVKVSPGGDYIAASLYVGEEARFRVFDLATQEIKTSFGMGKERRINDFWWVTDDIVIVTPAQRVPGSDFYYPTGAKLAIEVQSGRNTDLQFGFLYDVMPDEEDSIMVMGYEGRHSEVYRMDIKSSAKQQLARSANPGGLFVFDRDRSIVFTMGENELGDQEVHYREGRGRWEHITTTPFGEDGWSPVAFGLTPGTFLSIDSRRSKGNVAGLFSYDPETREHKAIIQHPVVDIGFGSLQRDYHGNVYAVNFEYHYPQTQYLNNNHLLSQVHKLVQSQFKEYRVSLSSFSSDHKKVVASVNGDRKPGEFYLVDADAQSMDQIAQVRPELTPDKLAVMSPVEVQSRDKTTLYGYVTSMPGAPMPGPMVVVPHGGPHGVRDFWGFNQTAQILATRGYHVLQINYRGSSGYGGDYQRAGYARWADLIQHDIIDATRWAIAANVADPKRICIAGSSFGAYSALMNIAIEPNLYQCAIGVSGIYDMTLMERAGDTRQLRSGERFLELMLSRNRDRRREISPISYVENMKAAVMLVHGGQDRQSPPVHAHRMRTALENSGKEVDWLFESDQGHGFIGPETLLNYWNRQLAFLEKHIGT